MAGSMKTTSGMLRHVVSKNVIDSSEVPTEVLVSFLSLHSTTSQKMVMFLTDSLEAGVFKCHHCPAGLLCQMKPNHLQSEFLWSININ
jgi:hypothetical protein